MARGRMMVFLILAVVAKQVKAHNYNRPSIADQDEVEQSRDEDSWKSTKKQTTDTTSMKTRFKIPNTLPTDTPRLDTSTTFMFAHRTGDDTSPDNAAISVAVPVGVAVGLLFLGLVVGAIVTCLLCACVPSLNKKATSFLTRHRIPIDSANTKKKGPALDSQVQPTAPPASFRIENQNDTHADDQRGSHIYNQPGMSFNSRSRQTTGNVNSKMPPNHIQTSQAIASPVYNELTDDIIASSSKATDPEYQPLNAGTMDGAMYGYRQLGPSGHGENFPNQKGSAVKVPENIGTSEDHNYFILHPECSTAVDLASCSADDRDTSAHAYFVLEKNSGS